MPKSSVGSICDNGTIKKLKARALKSSLHRARFEYTWNMDPVIVWKGASLDEIIKNARRKDEPTLKMYLRHFVP